MRPTFQMIQCESRSLIELRHAGVLTTRMYVKDASEIIVLTNHAAVDTIITQK